MTWTATPQARLRSSVAACAAFRSLVGASAAAEALPRVWYEDLPPPANGEDVHGDLEIQAYAPWARVIVAPGGFRLSQAGMGGHDEFDESGVLLLELVRQAPTTMERTAADEDWAGLVYDLARQLGNLSGDTSTATQYLAFQELTVEAGPGRWAFDAWSGLGECQVVLFQISWGNRQ
jgi:hypothetical protein